VALNPRRKSSMLLFVADVLTVAVAFNLVMYLRGVGSEPFVWPLLAPEIVFI